jgi:alpha-2-macroglobulin
MRSPVFRVSILAILALAVIGAAGGTSRAQERGAASVSRGPTVPVVDALPSPGLPDWIRGITPTGDAGTLAQIRVDFKNALIPVEKIDSPDQVHLLKYFTVTPALAGHFRFLTPRMVGFQADRALPGATRVRVTLRTGLADLAHNRLERDLSWTFQTEPIALELPCCGPFDLKPHFFIYSNVELDLASLRSRFRMVPAAGGTPIPVRIDKVDTRDWYSSEDRPQQRFDPTETVAQIYRLSLPGPLAKDTSYDFHVMPGVWPVHGNLATDKNIDSGIATYAPLEFLGIAYTTDRDGVPVGRFTNGDPYMTFNNGVSADSAVHNISYVPGPVGTAHPIRTFTDDNRFDINPDALTPRTTYTLHVGAQVEDVYKQLLGQPVGAAFHTDDYSPWLALPEGFNIVAPDQPAVLAVQGINLPDERYYASYHVYKPTDLVHRDVLAGSWDDPWDKLLGATSSWQSYRVSASLNEIAHVDISAQRIIGASSGVFAYGVGAKILNYDDRVQHLHDPHALYGALELTNLGIFAQWMVDGGFVSVRHLTDGSPVPGATVEIYPLGTPTPCTTAKTDADGIAMLGLDRLGSCKLWSLTDAPKMLIVAREKQDWAFVRIGGSDYTDTPPGYGWWEGWNRATIFTDRQLYQPGETVNFTGVVYSVFGGVLVPVARTDFPLLLDAPDGTESELGTFHTDDLGTFTSTVRLKAAQRLGNYTIRSGDWAIVGHFDVQEFKPPNFSVDLRVNHHLAFAGQRVDASSTTSYLFGTPVVNATARFLVQRTMTYFPPPGRDEFWFGPSYIDPDSPPALPDLSQPPAMRTDTAGHSKTSFLIPSDLPYPVHYRVDSEISDASNQTVASHQDFAALPSPQLIGLDCDQIVESEKAFKVRVIVVDPMGHALRGVRTHVELQAEHFDENAAGQTQSSYAAVDHADVASAPSAITISLKPPKGGPYRILASVVGGATPRGLSSRYVWAAGNEVESWAPQTGGNPDGLQIVLDKATYRIGDTATALIKSPYDHATMYFAVLRRKTYSQAFAPVDARGPTMRFTITPDMLPNAVVEAVLVRRGPRAAGSPASNAQLAAIGFAPFRVKLDDRYLHVAVVPAKPSPAPGTRQSVDLRLTDSAGAPVSGQFAVMVVNDDILQLTGYRPPDLVQIMYADFPIALVYGNNRTHVLPPVAVKTLGTVTTRNSSALIRPGTTADMYSVAAPAARKQIANNPIRLRHNFLPNALYRGAVVSDSRGHARVDFTLPDDLTTWRVMVVAISSSASSKPPNARFGNGEATFITTKPLLANPLVPQFVRPGDRFSAGIAVTNKAGRSGPLDITGALFGPLSFATSAGLSQGHSLMTALQPNTAAYRFPMVARGLGPGALRFTVRTAHDGDALEVPLDSEPLEVTEQAVEVGVTTSQVTIPVDVGHDVVPSAGGLDITMASSLVADIVPAAQNSVETWDYPFLSPLASRLAIAADLHVLSRRYGNVSGLDLPAFVAHDLGRVAVLQVGDGGFTGWPGGSRSDPFESAYLAECLGRVGRAGFAVDPSMKSRLHDYLANVAEHPDYYFPNAFMSPPFVAYVRFAMLRGLDGLGDKRDMYLEPIYALRGYFDYATQVRLARYLYGFPAWRSQGVALTGELRKSIYVTGRYASVNVPERWSWFSSPTALQSAALELFITAGDDIESLDRFTQALLTLRHQGTWRNSYDNAEALGALVDYSELEATPPSFMASAQLAGSTIASGTFSGYSNSLRNVHVAMARLPHGRNDLHVAKAGTGTLHYVIAYRYRLTDPQPGRLSGLRITRQVHFANQEASIAEIGLASPSKPLALGVAQTYDIGLEIITDHPVDHVLITDPLPAGFEAVNESFRTATSYFRSQPGSWEIDYTDLHRDRVFAYADHLDTGIHTLHYLARAVTPGMFVWPGAHVELEYAPEEFGRCASSLLRLY